MARSPWLSLVIALCAASCGSDDPPARSLRWEIAFDDPAVAMRAAVVVAEVRRGTCGERGEVIYRAAIAPGATAPGVPALADGTYAFAASARDASCVVVARGCADETLPANEGEVVSTILFGAAAGLPECAPCTLGMCGGDLDAGLDDAGPFDAGRIGPPPPELVYPWNGLVTGVHGAFPLRARFVWRPVAEATRYELQLHDGCPAGLPAACAFPPFAGGPTTSATTLELGAAEIPGAIAGARVHFRVRSCDDLGCGSWSLPRWIDAGRERRDVDGDGDGDLLIGAPKEDRAGADSGAAYLYRDVLGAATAEEIVPGAAGADSWYGNALDVGDIDGDGLADAVIGMEESDRTGTDAGAIVVVRGLAAAPWLDVAGAQIIDPPAGSGPTKYFGQSIAIVDDFDGDGFRDVLVGSPNTGVALGRAYVYRGRADPMQLLEPAPAFSVVDPDESVDARFGFTVAAAGDVDGDGLGDLLIGSPNLTVAGDVDRGRARVYRTTALGDPIVLDGVAQADVYFGMALASAGDVNEDGFGDVLVGAPDEDFIGQPGTDHGRAYLYLGGPSLIDRVVAETFESSVPYSDVHAGWSVAAGDVNGDGHLDVIVPQPEIDHATGGNRDRGIAVVYEGDGAGGFVDRTTLYPERADGTTEDQAQLGFCRSAVVLDLDGDGRDELVCGAHRYDVSTTALDVGRVWWFVDPVGAASTGFLPSPNASGDTYFGYALPGSVGRVRE